MRARAPGPVGSSALSHDILLVPWIKDELRTKNVRLSISHDVRDQALVKALALRRHLGATVEDIRNHAQRTWFC